MAQQYIPSGRTSVVKKGDAEFQLQTEYAALPQPRVTTTIFSGGQVLHKVEKPVAGPIATVEEMHQVEEIIRVQHLEVSKIIRERGLPTVPVGAGIPATKSRLERLRNLEEVEMVFLVTAEGRLVDRGQVTPRFKKLFKPVLKELPSLITVFCDLPGSRGRREEGVYEVEPGRIFLASTGVEFYLILVREGTGYSLVADKIKNILAV